MRENHRSVGTLLSEQFIDELDDRATEHDATRSAVIRALLTIGIRQADSMDYDEFHHHVQENHALNAAMMTEEGYHPRWDK